MPHDVPFDPITMNSDDANDPLRFEQRIARDLPPCTWCAVIFVNARPARAASMYFAAGRACAKSASDPFAP